MAFRTRLPTFFLILTIGLTLPLPPLVITPPPPPQLISPTTGAKTTSSNYPPTGTPDFAWSPVSGASLYRIQLSKNPSFTGTPTVNQVTPYTRYTPVVYLPDGLWYWRMRVESPLKSEYSTFWQFTKQWAAPENHPVLLSPDDQTALDFFDSPAFSWKPVMGATSYRYQVASDNLFTATSLKVNIVTSSTSYQPLSKLANGSYYWRVIPIDMNGGAGTASLVRSFRMSYGSTAAGYSDEIPTLLEPPDQASVPLAEFNGPLFSPTFHWMAVRGASAYLLQYTPDSSCSFSSGDPQSITTQNTSYTPESMLKNGQTYCWRVRAISGQSQSDWSAVWKFTRQWDIPPVLLTPPDLAQNVSTLSFRWTPVPGASQYQLEVDQDGSFTKPLFTIATSHSYAYILDDTPFLPDPGKIYYWRVTPLDSGGNPGRSSEVFGFTGGSAAPQLISPPYYYSYPPAGYPADSELDPRQDPTTAYPVFTWHRWLTGTVQAGAYRIQVSVNPSFTPPLAWSVDTEALSAAPTLENPFTPQPGVSYYWRIHALSGINGTLLGDWSDTWLARFNPALAPAPSPTIALSRPRQAAEVVESVPLLEWQPLQGAVKYEVQISPYPGFYPISGTIKTRYPVYVPTERLDNYPEFGDIDLEYGSYYWRVRGNGEDGKPIGDWSSSRRFQVAAQDGWRQDKVLGSLANNGCLVAVDKQYEVGESYDLTNLYAAADTASGQDAWHFGFDVPGLGSSVAYVLYLDTDQVDSSGANSDAEGYQLFATPAHRPEFAFYLSPNGGDPVPFDIHLHRWQDGSWLEGQSMAETGGSLYYSGDLHYIELALPAVSIGMESKTRSLSLTLASVDRNTKNLKDSVPAGNPDNNTLTRFATISGRLTIAAPALDAVLPEMPSFSWHLPPETPWHGYQIQIDHDPDMVSPLVDRVIDASDLVYPDFGLNNELDRNGLYYWRVRPIYIHPGGPAGPWSELSTFELKLFEPINLEETTSSGPPAFQWSRVEGADSYEMEVDHDPDFQTPEFGRVTTHQNMFSFPVNLAPGTYSWHVRVNHSGTIQSDWSAPESFQVTLPVPAGLTPDNQSFDNTLPTLCWTPLVANSNSLPVFAVFMYEVQIGKENDFSTLSASVETEQSCWTPGSSADGKSAVNFPDGIYSWRVAAIDASNNRSAFSPADYFAKRFPAPTLTAPSGSGAIPFPLTFSWQPVHGAARYILEVSCDPSFTSPLEVIATPNTRYTPVIPYPPTGALYWRVAAVDQNGNSGPHAWAAIRAGKVFFPAIRRW